MQIELRGTSAVGKKSDDIRILPGHGDETTVWAERARWIDFVAGESRN